MAEPLWAFDELVRVAGGAADGAATQPVTGFSIDTRSLGPGDVFVALRDQRDGHDFVTAAFAAGGPAALVEAGYQRKPGDGALIRVDDPLRALERIGVAARARLSAAARVIAVTGSAGKTGTKEMLRACLKVCASSPERVHAPEKSFNNHWGVPLTLARMPVDTEFGVFEIGMSHAGEIGPLAQMVRPHVAIVTNVLPVHVGNFADGVEGVARAKAEIFEGLEAGGTAIILGDSPHYDLLRERAEAGGARVVSFGRAEGCDVRLSSVQIGTGARQSRARISVRIARNNSEIDYTSGMIGRHLATNSAAVIAALDCLACDVALASGALAGIQSAAGRGQRVLLKAPDGDVLLLDESYNANPASMREALATLAQIQDARVSRRIAVMGDMLELGADAARYHVGLLDAASRADLVFCCGPNMRHLFDALPASNRGGWAPASSDLIPKVLAAIGPGDAIMVKGSLGSRMAPIVDAIKKRFAQP